MTSFNDIQEKQQHLQAENHRLQLLLLETNTQMNEAMKVINAHQQRLHAQDEQLKNQEKQLAEKATLVTTLQKENTQHKETLAENEAEIETLSQRIAYLKEQLALLLSKRFKAQSEQSKYIQGQLFDESELEQAISETQAQLDELEDQATDAPSTQKKAKPPKEKKQPKRNPLPEHYRRVEIEIDVPEEEKQAMGDDWQFIGFEISEQLAVQQREYYVKQIKRKKYALKSTQHSESAEGEAGIRVAPAAKVILPKALADASLLADVLTSKFVDGMSFYRTHKRLEREGVNLGYSTLCNYPIQLHEKLEDFKQLFYEEASKASVWHLDETTLQVLDEPDRPNHQISRIWALRTGPPNRPLVIFHYDERRNYTALENWLRPCLDNFNGVIITDEHKPYNILRESYENIRGHGGCWFHARRKFVDASKGRKPDSDAHKAIQKIAKLNSLEKSIEHLSGDEKLKARKEKVSPHLENIKAFLEKIKSNYLYKGLMRTAINYALNNWHKLTAFLDHAEMPIHNNLVENAIRPFTIGRKNFLFSGSPKGAHASAFIYSLIETAKANGLEPQRYLQALFEQYPLAKNKEERLALLPTRFQFSK